MSSKNQNQVTIFNYKNLNELLSSDCTPLLDILFKLSSIATNFASAAHNTKNITIEDRHEIDELLNLVFETRKLADKVEKLLEEKIENSASIIKSGVFEKVMFEKAKKEALEEAIEVSEIVKKSIKPKEMKHEFKQKPNQESTQEPSQETMQEANGESTQDSKQQLKKE